MLAVFAYIVACLTSFLSRSFDIDYLSEGQTGNKPVWLCDFSPNPVKKEREKKVHIKSVRSAFQCIERAFKLSYIIFVHTLRSTFWSWLADQWALNCCLSVCIASLLRFYEILVRSRSVNSFFIFFSRKLFYVTNRSGVKLLHRGARLKKLNGWHFPLAPDNSVRVSLSS